MKYIFKGIFYLLEWTIKCGLYFLWNFEYKSLENINKEGIFDFDCYSDDFGPM